MIHPGAFSINVFTDPQPLTSTKAGVLMAGLSAAVPAMMMGSFMAASAAGYTEKQRDWALKGAMAAGLFAASMFFLNFVRKREQEHQSALPGLGKLLDPHGRSM